MSDSIVKAQNLSRRFGQQLALNDVTFSIKPGFVYGLVGANGAGKTTLIKHLLGLYQAQMGWVRVFDQDPVVDPVGVLAQIGYLSEDREMPEWMRVDEMLRYTAAFYPTWDWDYALELLATFGLDPRKKINQLSRGGKAQVGLITAVAHRPKLLLLDEPSSGLDPLVRKDILNAIVKVISEEGRTVIFSSHLLDEIDMMSDYLLMLQQGQLVMFGELDEIKSKHHSVSARWPDHVSQPPLTETCSVERIGNDWWLVFEGNGEQIQQSVTHSGGEILSQRNASLHEIFTARASRVGLLERQSGGQS
jgi:ABC-2 type transport system ATP-binding protein